MAQEIQRDAYGTLTFEPSLALFRFSRSPEVFRSVEEAKRSFDEMYQEMVSYERGRYRILLDLRRGPLRADPGFEEVVKQHQQRIFAFVTRVAILIQSSFGVLQMVRQRREGWPLGMVFNDEAEALAYLTEDPGC